MKYIQTLHEGDDIQEIYLCKQIRYMETKNGKEYIALNLADKTGELDSKIWDIGPGIDDCEAGDYVRVSGKVTMFNNTLQLSVRRLQKCREGEYILSDYIPSSQYDIEAMYKTLLSYVASVQEPHLHAILEEFFVKDEELIKKFKACSAAKGVHHAFYGGLLEHTVSVTANCVFFAKKYPMLNKDLLITAALLHDVAKTREFSPFPENDYTEDGNLLGHIVMGVSMLNEKLPNVPDFPPLLFSELCHCILAHHGELEFGSPKKPELAEAFALNFADNLDAKMETLKELFDANLLSSDKSGWLGYQRFFESNIRRTVVD